MGSVAEINIINFGVVYLLLFVVLFVMKKSRIQQTKLLVIASVRMTLQLVLCGVILTLIFDNPHPIWVVLYVVLMLSFASWTIFSQNKSLNNRFKKTIVIVLSLGGLLMGLFFMEIIVSVSFFNPQYTIPILGMIIGNSMNGISLGIRTIYNLLESDRNKISVLQSLGVPPRNILIPLVNKSTETALLPTLNSMLGMGIVSLPGMMTGQILSGTSPNTAILYQIAIMIAITTVSCVTVFFSLYFGIRTLYDNRELINFK